MFDLKGYRILDLVATGGTAELYKAIQTSLDRVVAVKKLHSHLTEDENFTRRFELEAKAAASLDDDNIVKIIDFGTHGGSYHMVMEFIEGESLRGILDRWKVLPMELALAIAHHVCLGLEHAHAKGIVHRDIKPGNVMITRAGKVKITDFGLAKLTQTATQHTATNSILGTPLYMSPEQAFGETVDNRSDIFSMGTMLYEMLTGIQPFKDDSYMAVIQNIINRNVPHPSRYDIEMPSPVQSILGKAMNKARDARFQTAAEFRRAIEKYMGLHRLNEASKNLAHLLATDGETVVLPKTAKSRKRERRLRKGFVTALVVTLLFGAAVTGYTYAPALERYALAVTDWVRSTQPVVTDAVTAKLQDVTETVTEALTDSSTTTAQPDTAATRGPSQSIPALGETAAAETPTSGAESTQSPTTQPAEVAAAPTQSSGEPVAEVAGTAASDSSPVSSPPVPTPVASEEPSKPAQVAKGWISVTVEPWAEIYVDGVYRGDASPEKRIELDRGEHTLECRNPTTDLYHETIVITAGELSTRNIVLEALTGAIDVKTADGAEVLVDGRAVGVTPLPGPLDLGVGEHQIMIKKAGFNVWNNQVIVVADETLNLNITLSPIYQ